MELVKIESVGNKKIVDIPTYEKNEKSPVKSELVDIQPYDKSSQGVSKDELVDIQPLNKNDLQTKRLTKSEITLIKEKLGTKVNIDKFALPETGKKYSDEQVEEAQKEYDNLSLEEQENVKKAYENGVAEYKEMVKEAKIKAVTIIGIDIYPSKEPTMDEFLKEHPEYIESFDIMGPIAQDYNEFLQEGASEYKENAPWYEKIALNAGFSTPGLKKCMNDVKALYKSSWENE